MCEDDAVLRYSINCLCRVKDWLVFTHRNSSSSGQRDVVRDRVSDELTSLVVWCAVAVGCVDALSLKLGIAVGGCITLHHLNPNQTFR